MAGTSAARLGPDSGDEPVFVLNHMFDAPREAVWRAMTEAPSLRRWWSPQESETAACEIDLRPGGRWRIAGRSDRGALEWHGVHLEVLAPARLVRTIALDGWAVDGLVVETCWLKEHEGWTLVTSLYRFDSPGERDGFADTGLVEMERRFARLESWLRMSDSRFTGRLSSATGRFR